MTEERRWKNSNLWKNNSYKHSHRKSDLFLDRWYLRLVFNAIITTEQRLLQERSWASWQRNATR